MGGQKRQTLGSVKDPRPSVTEGATEVGPNHPRRADLYLAEASLLQQQLQRSTRKIIEMNDAKIAQQSARKPTEGQRQAPHGGLDGKIRDANDQEAARFQHPMGLLELAQRVVQMIEDIDERHHVKDGFGETRLGQLPLEEVEAKLLFGAPTRERGDLYPRRFPSNLESLVDEQPAGAPHVQEASGRPPCPDLLKQPSEEPTTVVVRFSA